MSGRPTADLVADLRKVWTLGDAYTFPLPAAIEAADRLAELDAEVNRLEIELAAKRGAIYALQHQPIDALRPPCLTCGGAQIVLREVDSPDCAVIDVPCPDCIDGKVPIERLVKVFEAVFSDEPLTIYPKSSGLSGVIDATLAVLRRAE